jgi:hypothetical protein
LTRRRGVFDVHRPEVKQPVAQLGVHVHGEKSSTNTASKDTSNYIKIKKKPPEIFVWIFFYILKYYFVMA